MLTFAFVIACIFFFQKDVKAAEKTGTVTFSIERFTIGQGYLIEPCQVDIYDTDNIASVVDRVLTQEGYGYENKGKIQDGFYLEQIYNGDTGKVRIPSIISDGQLQPIKIKSIKKLKKNQAKLTWKKVKNATGYEVYQSMKKNSGYKKVKTITKNKTVTYKAGKLKKKKTYYFKIRTYRKAGGTTYYGNYSNVKKMKVK